MFDSLKAKVIGILVAIGLGLILIFAKGIYSPAPQEKIVKQTAIKPAEDQVDLVSTTPPNLDGATISPSQTIEFTFNYSIDETNQKFQFNLDPAIDLKVETSADHKTLKMTAIKGFGFDQGYTLQIKSGNPFAGGTKLDHDINMHFTTTSYSGI
jgi:hypothetical protein